MNISFDEELDLGVEYHLSCSGLKDAKGNEMPDDVATILLEYEEDPDIPDVPKPLLVLFSVVSVLMR